MNEEACQVAQLLKDALPGFQGADADCSAAVDELVNKLHMMYTTGFGQLTACERFLGQRLIDAFEAQQTCCTKENCGSHD